MPLRLAVCLPVLFFSASLPQTQAKDYFLTIGGGYTPSANQASLEKNVLFFQRVLRSRSPDHVANDIYFSDGNQPGDDLQVLDRQAVPKANRLMAEFFGSQRGLGLSYRNHQIPNVRGGTDPVAIGHWFDNVGSTMQAGDRLLIYVTAHGKSSKDQNPYNTTIAGWNNKSIPMTDLVGMLDRLPAEVEVVAVMVQCHSGGFARFMFNAGDPDRGVSAQRRIGFFATVHDRPAAGCTPEVNEADYVEYSTYFWSALSGRDRRGNVIQLPDYNHDNVVSFDEAHAYTILTADTIDLPVKTSGEYLRVHSEFGDGHSTLMNRNESYALILKCASESQRTVLEGLSHQLELSGDDRIADARRTLQRQRSNRRGRSYYRSSKKEQLRRKISADLKRRWPGLANIMNPISIELVTDRRDEFIKAIETHPDYRRYRSLENDQNPSYQKIKVKYERFLRVAENVILAENLRRIGDVQTLAQFESIVAAEARTLNALGTQATTEAAKSQDGNPIY